jgi:hypothetical protein
MTRTVYKGPNGRQPVTTDARVCAAALLPCTFVTESATQFAQATVPGTTFLRLLADDWNDAHQAYQRDAARYAADLQDKQFQQTRADFAPYAGAGQRGLDTYEQELRGGQYAPGQFDFQARTRDYDLGGDPVFQNALDQAMKRNAQAPLGIGS